jgi:ABC-2 type transport system permease protein
MYLFDRLNQPAIGSWASVIGSLALVAGGLLYLFGGAITIGVFLCVMVGVGGIALWMWWAPGEFQAWLAGRQTRFGTTSLLITVLFTGLVVAVYVVVDRANITVDLTSIQRYSLSGTTQNVIEDLKAQDYKVRIVGFFSRRKLAEQEKADLLLRQYEVYGDGAIQVQYIDPDEKPDVAALYGYQPGYDGTLFLNVLNAEGELEYVADPDGSQRLRYSPIYLGPVDEREISEGLNQVAQAGAIKIYFTTGHGERDLTRIDEIGISRLASSLVGMGIAVEPLDLSTVNAIPADASAVLIIGARSPFDADDVALIEAYMARGGRLGIFADPPLVEDQLPGFDVSMPDEGPYTFLQEGSIFSNYLWDEFGVRVKDELLVETKVFQANPIATSEFTPIVDIIAPHSIMQGSRDEMVVLQHARPLELVAEPNVQQMLYTRQQLLFSSEQSFGETDLLQAASESQNVVQYTPGEDTPGPLLMGVTVKRNLEQQEDIQPRLLIIGDSDVLKNEFVSSIPGNVFLWTDVVDWLTGFSRQLQFPVISDTTLQPVVASDQERRVIAYITMLVLPGLVLMSGMIVWWYRQR